MTDVITLKAVSKSLCAFSGEHAHTRAYDARQNAFKLHNTKGCTSISKTNWAMKLNSFSFAHKDIGSHNWYCILEKNQFNSVVTIHNGKR